MSANDVVIRMVDYWQRHKLLLAILGLALIARVTVLLLYLSANEWKGETWEYEVIANNLLEGRGLSFPYNGTVYRSYVVPVFPLISAFLHFIGGPGLGLYYFFHLSTALGIIWLTYTITQQWFGARTAILAALLTALEPGLIIYQSYKVDVITLSTFLLLLGLYCFILMMRTRDGRYAVLIGLIIGVGVLTRLDLISLMAVPAVWFILERKELRRALKPVTLIVCTACVVMIPWITRNYSVYGQFVPFTTATGEVLWRGNNPNATGTSVTMDSHCQFRAAPTEFRNRVLAASEIQQNAIFRAEALRYIKQDPAGFVWRTIQKVYYFWWFSPTYAANYYEWAPALLVTMYQWSYAGVLALMLLGVWFALRDRRRGLWPIALYLLALPISVSLLHSVTYVEGRHRVMVMPVILILVAHGMISLYTSVVRTSEDT